MKRVYFDSNIFISYVNKRQSSHELIIKFIKYLENLDIEVYFSEWSVIETLKVLKKNYNYSNERINQINTKFLIDRKIGEINLNLIDLDKNKISFKYFFDFLKQSLLEIKETNITDLIHCCIMNSNDINAIISTDNDFQVFKKVTWIDPNQIMALN